MSRGSPIPTVSRRLVRVRDLWACVRCGVPVRSSAWHHRRTRSVVDEHQHATCNGITLCHVCHPWVHAHPLLARLKGWIVSSHANPCEVRVSTVQHGWVLLDHDGDITLVPPPQEERDDSD